MYIRLIKYVINFYGIGCKTLQTLLTLTTDQKVKGLNPFGVTHNAIKASILNIYGLFSLIGTT